MVRAALSISVPLRTGGRAAGLRLRASDLDCEWGQGQEMTGTGEALLMAVTGRRIFASPAVTAILFDAADGRRVCKVCVARGRRTHSFAADRASGRIAVAPPVTSAAFPRKRLMGTWQVTARCARGR
jgi:hypothetical protein